MDLAALNLALSTSWNVRRHERLAPALIEIRKLGFHLVELNSVLPAMVPGLHEELARLGMAVQSLHDPCPWPVDAAGERIGWGAVPELSAPRSEERLSALAQARRTIELARHLGARAVIVHLGQVETSVTQPELLALLRSGRRDEYLRLRARALAEREARREPYLQSALACIRELGEWAGEAGVSLGVEIRLVFAACEGLPVYYWHDTGHAYRQELLGLATADAYLQRFNGRLLGAHLHDARPDRDHLAPGLGELDLTDIGAHLPAGALRTLELSDSATAEQIRTAVVRLRQLGLA